MDLIIDLTIIIICLTGLWIGSDWIVEGAVNLSRKLGISELIIGLTIVSIGTSAPEFGVTILSVLKGYDNISVGNIVGSNIFNLGFILGSVAIVHPIKTSRTLVRRDGTVLIIATFSLLIFMMDFHLSFVEGAILLCFLIMYVSYLFSCRESLLSEISTMIFKWYHPLQMFAGLVFILLSSHFLINSAVSTARMLGISEWVIGVTIIAVGTSLPELVTSIRAVLEGHPGLSAGNLVGSDIFNLLGVLGLAAVMKPMTVSAEAYGSLYLLCGVVIIVVIMMRTGWIVSRREGLLLVLISMVRWVMDFTR